MNIATRKNSYEENDAVAILCKMLPQSFTARFLNMKFTQHYLTFTFGDNLVSSKLNNPIGPPTSTQFNVLPIPKIAPILIYV